MVRLKIVLAYATIECTKSSIQEAYLYMKGLGRNVVSYSITPV